MSELSVLSDTDNTDGFDILIVGGGLVGASLAVALAQPAEGVKPLKIGVVEAYPMPENPVLEGYQPSFDARSTAISWGTRLIYENLGLWHRIAERSAPIRNIHVSDRGNFGATRMSASEMNCEALGYVVENQWLGLNLMSAMGSLSNVHWICPASVESIQLGETQSSVFLLQGGRSFRLGASLVVLADGGRSSLRQQLGIDLVTEAYQQHALIANVEVQKPHNAWAYERFTEQGPMALLPLLGTETAKNRMALVWTLPNDSVQSMLDCDDQVFLEMLQDRFGFRLGRFLAVGERFAYPLKLEYSKEQVRSRLAVVGNAAHALHPVAGQGYNLALRGAMTLSSIVRDAWLEKAKDQEVDIGSLRVLSRYQNWHESDQFKTTFFSDQLVKMFSNAKTGLSAARDMGLIGLDLALPAKKQFAKQAMGLG